jgi:hypothetical protein
MLDGEADFSAKGELKLEWLQLLSSKARAQLSVSPAPWCTGSAFYQGAI